MRHIHLLRSALHNYTYDYLSLTMEQDEDDKLNA